MRCGCFLISSHSHRRPGRGQWGQHLWFDGGATNEKGEEALTLLRCALRPPSRAKIKLPREEDAHGCAVENCTFASTLSCVVEAKSITSRVFIVCASFSLVISLAALNLVVVEPPGVRRWAFWYVVSRRTTARREPRESGERTFVFLLSLARGRPDVAGAGWRGRASSRARGDPPSNPSIQPAFINRIDVFVGALFYCTCTLDVLYVRYSGNNLEDDHTS